MSTEFHIFALNEGSMFELEMPGGVSRVEFSTLVEATRHARAHPHGKDARVVIHHRASNRARFRHFGDGFSRRR